MFNASVLYLDSPKLEELLELEERVLWSGAPDYGRKLFELRQNEKIVVICIAVGAVAMLLTLPFVPQGHGNSMRAAWAFLIVIAMLVCFLVTNALDRKMLLSNLAYFVTDRRAIVVRAQKGLFRDGDVYVVSCRHSVEFPYSIRKNHPYASLRVGTLFDKERNRKALPDHVFDERARLRPLALSTWTTTHVEFENVREADYLRALIRSAAQKRETS